MYGVANAWERAIFSSFITEGRSLKKKDGAVRLSNVCERIILLNHSQVITPTWGMLKGTEIESCCCTWKWSYGNSYFCTVLVVHFSRFCHYSSFSYGVVYAAFMSCALLGSVSSRLYQKRVMASRVLCASSCACLIALVLAVFVIPSSPSDWSTYLFDILLLLFCLFEFAVGSYLPSMNKLQVPLYFIHFAICVVRWGRILFLCLTKWLGGQL